MGVKIGTTNLLESYIGGILTQVYTFDFANDGQQGWSNLTGFDSLMEGGFIDGEGFYLRSRNGDGTEAGFTTIAGGLPSGTLKKIKIWYYLPSSQTGAGINNRSRGTISGYTWEHNDKIGLGNATPITIGNYTGELTTEYNLTPTGCTGTCAGQSFSFTTNQANDFITAYNNGVLRLYLVNREERDTAYLRKVQLTIDV